MTTSRDDMNPFGSSDMLNPFSQVDAYNPFSNVGDNDPDHHDMSTVPLEPDLSSPELKIREENYEDYDTEYKDDDDLSSPNLVPTGPVKTRETLSTGRSRITVQQTKQQDETLHFWQLEFYQQFFNVDSSEVLYRCLRAMWPFKYDFLENVKGNPDFYGPFWISTTLIFLMAAAANFASYLDKRETWHYDFYKLTYGAAVIYGYTFGIPLIFWLYMKWVDIGISLIEVLCLYGYSLFVYSPVAILCIIPNSILQTVVVIVGWVISTSFLVVNLWMPLRERLGHAFIILIVMSLLHTGLALTFRLYFFLYNS